MGYQPVGQHRLDREHRQFIDDVDLFSYAIVCVCIPGIRYEMFISTITDCKREYQAVDVDLPLELDFCVFVKVLRTHLYVYGPSAGRSRSVERNGLHVYDHFNATTFTLVLVYVTCELNSLIT